ncbi:MAG: NAD(P)/FAD-dependent oxidoreductase [Solirubrobacterales bacterium]|nr:NAD(P)/FAD-dependent oxidoreductase [Solirubrobacterales bacterium]
MTPVHVNVLIVGAGLSGIGAAHHLQEAFPSRSYAILEAREAIGGTWDLFRYPGIRSDSDMHTLGYRFKPWLAEKAIADAPAILDYVREAAREGGIEEHIRFGHKVVRAAFSGRDGRWQVEVEVAGERVVFTADFLSICSGYYRYDEGFTPEFPGRERFGGEFIHPQHWPEELDYAGKQVVVIGSGATAMTLVPAMAKEAGHVTMLQRSPTYVFSLPDVDPIAKALEKWLPAKAAYALTRWKNITFQTLSYQASRAFPGPTKKVVRAFTKRQLPEGYDVDTHFKPTYDPWDQRFCLVPNADLFKALRRDTASIVTDHIETFTETGIELVGGDTLEADIVVSATGLNLLLMGGMELVVDGEPVELSSRMAYKGMMLEGLPNCIFTIGYTNASWTLKADLTSEYMIRVLRHMDRTGQTICVPENTDSSVETVPFMDFQANYVLRSLDAFPQQGSKAPWRLAQNYVRDAIALRRGQIDDGALRFSSPTGVEESEREPVAV